MNNDIAKGLADMSFADMSFSSLLAKPETPPLKNNIVLLVIEMCPLLGPLGIDRFYLGGVDCALAWVKLSVSLCTCCVGGIIWGLIDAVAIIVNGLQRQSSINVLGMHASFHPKETETAFALSIVTAVLQVFFCCCGCCGMSVRVGKTFGKHVSRTNQYN